MNSHYNGLKKLRVTTPPVLILSGFPANICVLYTCLLESSVLPLDLNIKVFQLVSLLLYAITGF